MIFDSKIIVYSLVDNLDEVAIITFIDNLTNALKVLKRINI